MRDQLGLPMEYDPKGHAFFYSRPVASELFGVHHGTQITEAAPPARQDAVEPIGSNLLPMGTTPLELEHAADLAGICARYGVRAEHVLRSMLREAFMDALDSPRLMDNIVRGARALAMESEVAA